MYTIFGVLIMSLFSNKITNQNVVVRKELMSRLIELIEQSDLSQAYIAEALNISQPRVSNLLNRKIELFSIDVLVNFLGRLGTVVEFTYRSLIEEESAC